MGTKKISRETSKTVQVKEDPVTKELIYVAVSITNGCEYCTRSHSYAAKKKGATEFIARLP